MKLTKLIKLALAGILVLSLAACGSTTPAPTPTPNPETATEETDILVVGGGLAGISAAIKAAQNGANVILIEKTAVIGGSSAYSGGGIGASGSSIQKEYDIDDTNESWLQLWHERQETSPVKGEYPDYALVERLIDQSSATIDWMEDLGYSFFKPEGFGVDPVARLHYHAKEDGTKGNGSSMMIALTEIAENLGVTILKETKAVSLIQNDAKEIVGVIAEDSNGTIQFNSQSVILASGGFARSEEMLQRFTPEVANYAQYSVSAPGNTGDGIVMAEAVGAVAYENPWLIGLGLTTPVRDLSGFYWNGNYMFVNRQGERFTNEAEHYSIVFNDAAYKSEGGSFMIFDSSATFEAYVAAAENNVDHESVFKADTLEELAAATGMNVENLVTSIENYNKAANGEADPFNKAAQLIFAMETAPYYAVEFFPSTMGTFGGIHVNENQQVLDSQGNVIAGLYAAGEMANRPYYAQVYMSGSALQVATQTGQIAGQTAAEAIK